MVTEDSLLNNPFAHGEKGRGINVADWLLDYGLDQIIVNKNLGGKARG